MKSWHVVAEWFAGVEQVAPYPGASGYEYRPTAIYKPCGMVIREAATEADAWRIFWDAYHGFSDDVRPWRNVRMANTTV